MEERIRELFASVLKEPIESFSDETRPADMARWDSVQHLILISGFEEEFEVCIEPEEAVEMYRDFGTFKSLILRKAGSNSQP